MKRVLLLTAALLGAGAGLAEEPGNTTLTLSGNRTTTFRYQHYSGLAPGVSGFYQSGFTRHETTRLKVSGHALETVKIEGEIYQNDVDFDNRYSLLLGTKNYELFLGEFPGSFEGSEFTLRSRNLQGAKLTGEVPLSDDGAPRVEFTVIGSSPRGEAKYEKFFGTDTQGPYRLGSIPVVLGSESVKVDKVPQVRNVDYELNYITGTITFKKRIIERHSLVEVTYEARQTLYPRSLYGAQAILHATETDSIGIMGVDERDRKERPTFDASGVPPTGHTVLGASYKHDGEFVRTGGEYAHSFLDTDLFGGGMEHGNAGKGEVEIERSGLTAGADLRRTEPRFRSPGNAELGSDLFGWSVHGGFGAGSLFRTEGRHEQMRTILEGGTDRLRTTDAKAQVAPEGWPRETYRYYQSDESFAANFNRVERRHTADVAHDLKYLAMSGGYERDDIMFRDSAQPDRSWDAARGSLGLKGIPWIAASLGSELRQGREENELSGGSHAFRTAIANTNLALTPSNRYYLGGSNNWQKTTGQSPRNTVRTEAKAAPIDQVSTQASFSQESLQMMFPSGMQAAHTDSYAGLIEVKPLGMVSLVYQPSLRETRASGVGPAVNANRRDGYTGKWAVGSAMSVEGDVTIEDFRLRDTSDPGLRIRTSQDTNTWRGAVRVSPVSAFSSELSYSDQMSGKEQFNSTSGGYDTRDTRQQTARVGVKPQLEAKLGINAAYQFERYRQAGSVGTATSLPVYEISPQAEQIGSFSRLNDFTTLLTHEHTVDGGASYQWTKSLISTAGMAYDLKQDRLGNVRDVSTLAANSGLTYRVRAIKVSGTYRLARSWGGASTRQQSFSGSLDVTPAEQVRWTTRVEYTTASEPATSATDATSSLEVSF